MAQSETNGTGGFLRHAMIGVLVLDHNDIVNLGMEYIRGLGMNAALACLLGIFGTSIFSRVSILTLKL